MDEGNYEAPQRTDNRAVTELGMRLVKSLELCRFGGRVRVLHSQEAAGVAQLSEVRRPAVGGRGGIWFRKHQFTCMIMCSVFVR